MTKFASFITPAESLVNTYFQGGTRQNAVEARDSGRLRYSLLIRPPLGQSSKPIIIIVD